MVVSGAHRSQGIERSPSSSSSTSRTAPTSRSVAWSPHRQRPATVGGITFLNVEDETGMVNVVCSPGLWVHGGGRNATAVLGRGVLESRHNVINLIANRLEQVDLVPHQER